MPFFRLGRLPQVVMDGKSGYCRRYLFGVDLRKPFLSAVILKELVHHRGRHGFRPTPAYLLRQLAVRVEPKQAPVLTSVVPKENEEVTMVDNSQEYRL